MLAQRIAQLDHMAQGRFYFGIGSGGFPGDFELFKVDNKEGEHRGLTTDMIELVLKLWEDPSPGDYDHKFWRVHGAGAARGDRAMAAHEALPAAASTHRRSRCVTQVRDATHGR